MARGDHIKVKRLHGLYEHHGIDLGDGTVIHFDGDPFRQINVCVRQSSMKEFLAGGQLITVDYAETPLAADLVCEAALKRLGESGYHLFRNNCEHFALACKLGDKGYSEQAVRLARFIVGAGVTVGALVGVASLNAIANSRRRRTQAA